MNIVIEFEKDKIVNGFFGFESEYVNNGFFRNNILLSSNRLFTSDSSKDSTILMRKKTFQKI